MYAVIRPPSYEPVNAAGVAVEANQEFVAYHIKDNHLPTDSQLFASVLTHEGTSFLGLNLQCSADQAGNVDKSTIRDTNKVVVAEEVPLQDNAGQPLDSFESRPVIPCGDDGLTSKIGYVLLLGLMIGTAFFQTLQTQRASPQGAASSQQQMILRIMPLFFGFIGFTFPSGLVLYWTVSNLFMIGQQTLLLRAGHIGPDALEKRMAEQKAKIAAQEGVPPKKGFMASMMERAEQERQQKDQTRRASDTGPRRAKSSPRKKTSGPPHRKPKPKGSGGKRGA